MITFADMTSKIFARDEFTQEYSFLLNVPSPKNEIIKPIPMPNQNKVLAICNNKEQDKVLGVIVYDPFDKIQSAGNQLRLNKDIKIHDM
jgi:hypothetical protein